jgi:hypothetical protein
MRWTMILFRCTRAACSRRRASISAPDRAGEFTVLGVVQGGVGAVPVLDDLEALVDLPAELFGGQVVADEGGAHQPAQLFEGLEGGVLGATPGELAQDLLGLGGAQAQGRGVLDELVVVAGDQLPVDGPGGHHRSEADPGLVVAGTPPG